MKRDAKHIPFVGASSYPIRAGNAVRPLVDGQQAFRRICEAIENARHSVWVTVAFMDRTFELPDGRGNLFDVLDAAQARGLDVRVIFWRHPEPDRFQLGTHFAGTAEERRALGDRGTQIEIRWDQASELHCQHQKSWLIDAGKPGETAFVGGINLNNRSVASPGHGARRVGNTHDVYVEVTGPSATDVHHNFVQRWNEASERNHRDGCWPESHERDDLPFPNASSPPAGSVPVQIQRTIGRGRYTNGHPPPGHGPFDIGNGERSVLLQYHHAIDAARETIYMEHQSIRAPEILDRLGAALARGVDVVMLIPVEAESDRGSARSDDARNALLAAFGRHDHFLLAGIASRDPSGGLQNVYVHAKIALIDDAWCTIGSANLHERSLHGHSELNASFWSEETVRALRVALLAEHLGEDTAHLNSREAMRRAREVARANRRRIAADTPFDGLAFAIDR